MKNVFVLGDILKKSLEIKPNEIILDDGKYKFSATEIERNAKEFACYLIDKGIKKGDRIIVLGSKTALMIPIAIGIWKAGAIYTPIDSELPKERFDNIVKNIQPSLIVLPTLSDKFWEKDINTVIIYEDFHINGWSGNENIVLPEIYPNDLGVIINTSGSTGTPKGVMLEHGSVLTYFDSHADVYRIDHTARVLNTTAYHFDVSIQDTFMPLYRGAFVYVTKPIYIPSYILQIIEDKKITHIIAVVTILALFTGDYENLDEYDILSVRILATGAEVVDPNLVAAWMERIPNLYVTNSYGPSEVNSSSMSYNIKYEDTKNGMYLPIGRPYPTVMALLVDDDLNVIDSPNIPGELLLGGPQVMRGYWNDPEATEHAFVKINDVKYYRTGDICLLNNDGNYVFQGRVDFEVKVAGRRINLLEISECLNSCENVVVATTSTLNIGKGKEIFVACRVKECDLNEIHNTLTNCLKTSFPKYMLPKYYIYYYSGFISSTGKTNIKDLSTVLAEKVSENPVSIFYEIC